MENEAQKSENSKIENEENYEQEEDDKSNYSIDPSEFANSKKKVKLSLGSSTLHILPAKLKDDSQCERKNVEEYFEKYIKEEKELDDKNENKECVKYTNLFRGRLMNGKKINVQNDKDLKINYVEIEKNRENNGEYKVVINYPVNEFYIWKYDESVDNENNFMKLKENMQKLDILS